MDEAALAHAITELRERGWATLSISRAHQLRYRQLVALARSFFGSTEHVKAKVDIRLSQGHRGWVSRDEAGSYADEGERRYEAFDIGRTPQPNDRHDHRFRGPNQWPQGLAGTNLQFAAETLFEILSGMADQVADAISTNLGVPCEMLRSLRQEPVSQFRLIEYFDPADSNAAMGAHTDYEFFTFVYQESAGTRCFIERLRWLRAVECPFRSLPVQIMTRLFDQSLVSSAPRCTLGTTFCNNCNATFPICGPRAVARSTCGRLATCSRRLSDGRSNRLASSARSAGDAAGFRKWAAVQSEPGSVNALCALPCDWPRSRRRIRVGVRPGARRCCAGRDHCTGIRLATR